MGGEQAAMTMRIVAEAVLKRARACRSTKPS
jgi:hypothetical protein